ncbi:hypothetical protein [Natrialba sp. SSL1]|nr:hypothetical protein [Natrialba sp. SSL1]
MYIDFRQKLIASIVGLGFAIVIIFFAPWWFAFLAFCAMIPFFAKLLTA